MDDPVKGVLGVRQLRLVRQQNTRTNARYRAGGGAKQMSGRGNFALELMIGGMLVLIIDIRSLTWPIELISAEPLLSFAQYFCRISSSALQLHCPSVNLSHNLECPRLQPSSIPSVLTIDYSNL
jgi:hypothetical protein